MEIDVSEYVALCIREDKAQGRKVTQERIEIAVYGFIRPAGILVKNGNVYREMLMTEEERNFILRRRTAKRRKLWSKRLRK
jgi:hypothetical protein